MYDKAWSRSVVANWWKLCTRTQLLTLHYETTISIYYPNLSLPPDGNLYEDLVVLLARSKADPAAKRLWTRFKRFADDGLALKDHPNNKTALFYAQIRVTAMRGFTYYKQKELFFY